MKPVWKLEKILFNIKCYGEFFYSGITLLWAQIEVIKYWNNGGNSKSKYSDGTEMKLEMDMINISNNMW